MTARSFGTVKSGEPRAEVGRDDGDSRWQGCWRWIAGLLSGCPRRFTSLWIGTTTKVRLAVVPLSIALLKSARAPFAVNIRREFEKCKRDTKRVNRVAALSGETENSGERVPQRAHGSNHADSPRQVTEQNHLEMYAVIGVILQKSARRMVSTNRALAFGRTEFGSPGRIRTYNPSVNSRMLYR